MDMARGGVHGVHSGCDVAVTSGLQAGNAELRQDSQLIFGLHGLFSDIGRAIHPPVAAQLALGLQRGHTLRAACRLPAPDQPHPGLRPRNHLRTAPRRAASHRQPASPRGFPHAARDCASAVASTASAEAAGNRIAGCCRAGQVRISLTIVPIALRRECSFIVLHHRHHCPPRGEQKVTAILGRTDTPRVERE